MERVELSIRIKNGKDGSAALSCTRADGSVLWQNQRGGQAAFFPKHDLTHVAVETVLGHRKGFFGLLAAGWTFDDFGSDWRKESYPADADPSELLVGFMDAQRATGAEWTASEINEQAAAYYAASRLNAPPPVITDDQLARIRRRMQDLFAQWESLPSGETLEVDFRT